MRVVWIHLPGLTQARVLAAGETMWSELDPTHHARLVPSFPWWRASILGSMRCGCLPREHRVLRTEDPPCDAHRDQICAIAPDRTVHEAKVSRVEELVPAARDGDAADLTVLHLSPVMWLEVPDLWPAILETLRTLQNQESRILLSGDCVRRKTAIEISLDSLPLDRDFTVAHAEERVAWLHAPSPPSAVWRDRVLEIPGVERVLSHRGLELYGFPPEDAVAVVLEPDHRFETQAEDVRVLDEGATEPLLLAWGDPSAPPWTDAAHDYRIAATIRAALGLSVERSRPPAGPLHLERS